MRSYDPKDVNVIVGGVALTGFAEGSFVSVERMEDTFTEYVGAQGDVAMSETSNETGEITVTLESTSPSVAYLNDLATRKGKNAIIPASVVDLNDNKVTAGGTECRVRKPATYEASNEITEREFVIFVSKLEFN
ncbi:phage structural protein [Dethiothermospora halolimnae]|uniref:phage structural protein n=1 Tax=Dethiothermospora halolimnae TaxID=3114390 RepID=UPI003CCBFFD7